jgi:hypothetical protein
MSRQPVKAVSASLSPLIATIAGIHDGVSGAKLGLPLGLPPYGIVVSFDSDSRG